MLRYGVIGTGAIGGYYGAKLAHSGQEVHFLLHKDYEYVKKNGLQVDSCDGSFHLSDVNAYSSTQDMPTCDVVFVCLKSVNNHLLAELLPPLLHQDTLVVLIQNGIGLEADVQKMFPRLELAAGLAFICSAKTEPGHINHQCYGYINIGNYSCHNEELMNQLIRDFKKANVDANLVEYHEARWKKAVWNMPFNGMTVALNLQTDKGTNAGSNSYSPANGCQHPDVLCRQNDTEHFGHDALFAKHEAGLRLLQAHGNLLPVYPSAGRGTKAWTPNAETGNAGSRTTVSGSPTERLKNWLCEEKTLSLHHFL